MESSVNPDDNQGEEPLAASVIVLPTSPVASYADLPRSQVARALQTLPPGVQQLLGIDHFLLGALDIMLCSAHTLLDRDDPRPVLDRFGWFDEAMAELGLEPGPQAGHALAEWITDFATEDRLQQVTKVNSSTWRRFLRRLIGAAAFDRIAVAVREDMRVISDVVDWGTVRLQPFAVAFDDCMSVIGSERICDMFGLEETVTALELVRRLHTASTKLRTEKFGEGLDSTALEPITDAAQLIDELRAMASGPTRQALGELSGDLSRKLEGARFALDQSVDGVSQAANSLVELIDRMLRTAFPHGEVLEWLEATGRSGAEYVHFRSSTPWPTKRAEALCFIYGGAVPEGGANPILDAFADVVVKIRKQLEAIKHADKATADEADQVRALIHSIEGFITIIIRLGWGAMAADRVAEIRRRFTA
ncbi:Uncharacterised protein [Nocardia africana]|uniref:Uncharacterized protein n=1 Tax=Nocardia africana TaxID=134964 RepID=A0A379X4K7_9NOCA|nr:Uncharacterised protein [Nocardia africana]